MEGELGSWETHMHRDALGPKHEGGGEEPLGVCCTMSRK